MLPNNFDAGPSYPQTNNSFPSYGDVREPGPSMISGVVHPQDSLPPEHSDEFWANLIPDMTHSSSLLPLPGAYDPSDVNTTNTLTVSFHDPNGDTSLELSQDGGYYSPSAPSHNAVPANGHFQTSITPSTPSAPMTPDPNVDLFPLFGHFPEDIPVPSDTVHQYPSKELSQQGPTEPSSPSPVLFLTDDARWEAVINRNAEANGHFLFCVKTTSVFCRPTCPSRRPSRSNVFFVFSLEEAQETGFRPCKRCKPEESMDPTQKRQMEIIERLKKELLRRRDVGDGGGEKMATVTKIAQDMGVSMWHLNRLFKRFVGTSPKAWAQQQLMQQELQKR
jgi:methylphosphotriester-DNA--protein-cysteine methyltransferase